MANRNRVLRSGASALVVIAALTVGHIVRLPAARLARQRK